MREALVKDRWSAGSRIAFDHSQATYRETETRRCPKNDSLDDVYFLEVFFFSQSRDSVLLVAPKTLMFFLWI